MVCTTRATPSGGSVSPDARARPGTKRVTRTPSAGRQYTTSGAAPAAPAAMRQRYSRSRSIPSTSAPGVPTRTTNVSPATSTRWLRLVIPPGSAVTVRPATPVQIGMRFSTSSMVGVIRGRDRAAESEAAASAGLRNIQPALGDLLLGVDERQPHDCGGMAGLLRQALHVDPLARRAVLDGDHGQPDVFLQ